MTRLKRKTELLALLRKAGRKINERQAHLDLVSIGERVRILRTYRRYGPGRRKSPARLLVDIAAPIYWAHTGKGPSYAEFGGDYGKKKYGGTYVKFVKLLAEENGIPFNPENLWSHCKEAREASQKDTFRTIEGQKVVNRTKLFLASMSTAYGDYGYEPAIDALEAFAHFAKRR